MRTFCPISFEKLQNMVLQVRNTVLHNTGSTFWTIRQ